MVKNYLLITLRSLLKNKVFILINISGLTIAIACCIIGYFNYDFNASFDSNHLNQSTIYRVNSVREFQNKFTTYGYVPMALGNVVKQNIPEVEAVVRYIPDGGNFRVGQELFRANINFVDPSMFKVFTFDFIEGDGALKDKSQICISDEMAEKYFGKGSALGKPMTQVLDSGRVKDYVVAGVFRKQPINSSFFVEAYAHFDNSFAIEKPTYKDPEYTENSWRFRQTLFLQIKDANRVKAIEEQLKPYAENNNKIREDFIIRSFELEPFTGMAVRDSYSHKQGTWTREGSPIAAVIGVGAMGILVLLIACFNLTNTAVAISSKRLKEIGIRKVMGSSRKSLIIQFIGETFLICLAGLLLGLVLGEYVLIPAFNQLWPDLKLVTDYTGKPDFMIFMGITLVFTSLLAGSYPAFYITRFQPTAILKGTVRFGGTNYFTRFLLTLQFIISLSGIVCSIAFTDNAKFQQQVDLGFDKAGVVYTYVSGFSEYETYRNALASNRDIISIAGSQHHFYSSAINDPIKHDSKEIEVDILDVDENYVNTLGLALLEGRNFEKDSENDRKESVIITEGLARKLGMKDPLGKEIIWMDTVKYYVVGVIQDVFNKGLWDEFDPAMLRYGKKEKIGHILVSAPAEKLRDVNLFMEAKWKEIFPNKLFNGRFMDDELVEANTVNSNILIMFVFLGVVALFLSATGLFTLVSLNIIKKMKEIGVRKVLGASMANISRVINKEFVVILLIASVLGGFAGAWMAGMLMDSIWDYYKETTYLTIVISAVILFATSAASIGHKVYATTKLNPANVLRDE